MADKQKNQPPADDTSEDRQTPETSRPNQPKTVTDPHPDTEEGYDKDHNVPMTGL